MKPTKLLFTSTKLVFGFILFSFNNLMLAQPAHIEEEHSNLYEIGQSFFDFGLNTNQNFMVQNTSNASLFWTISGNKMFKSGNGNETGIINFNEPGEYQLQFADAKKEQVETISIKVQPVNIEYLVEEAVFSTVLKKGILQENQTLKIPIIVISHKNQDYNLEPFRVSSTGIDGLELVNERTLQLKPGLNIVSFKLKGTAQDSGQAQFGLFDQSGKGYFYNFKVE